MIRRYLEMITPCALMKSNMYSGFKGEALEVKATPGRDRLAGGL